LLPVKQYSGGRTVSLVRSQSEKAAIALAGRNERKMRAEIYFARESAGCVLSASSNLR